MPVQRLNDGSQCRRDIQISIILSDRCRIANLPKYGSDDFSLKCLGHLKIDYWNLFVICNLMLACLPKGRVLIIHLSLFPRSYIMPPSAYSAQAGHRCISGRWIAWVPYFVRPACLFFSSTDRTNPAWPCEQPEGPA